MARKDIELRIRAKDDASRNAKKIADALKLISTDGLKAAESASKTGNALGALAADVGRLQNQTGNLKVLGAMVSEMDRARTNVERLERQLEGSGRAFASLRQETSRLGQASSELRRKIDAESSANATLNNKLIATTQAQKANNEAIKAATRAQEALNGARRKGIDVSGNRASTGVGIESGPPITSARESFGAFLAADIAAANATKQQLEKTIGGLKTAIDTSKSSMKGLRDELRQAEAAEREFANQTQRSGNAMLAMRADLHDAERTVGMLEQGVADANKALGTFAFTQEEVAKATDKAEAEMAQQARALAAFEKFSTKGLRGGGTIADPTAAERANKQAEAMRVAKEELALLRGEQARLDSVLRSSSGNVTTIVDAYDRMSRAVKLAEEGVRKLEIQQRLAASPATGGFGAWAKVYNPIVSGADAAAAAQGRMTAASRTAAVEAGKIAPAAQRASGSMRDVAQSSDAASVGLLNFGRSTRTTLSVAQRLRGEMLALTTSFIGFHAAIQQGRGAVDAFRDLESVQSRLGAVMKQDMGAVANEVTWLRGEANRLGIEFSVLGNQYAKFAVAADAANFSHENTRKMFLSVAEAGRVNKLSLDQLQGTFLAIEQIISKGKFTSEEVRRQLGDRLPGAFNILADAMGKTTAELDKMMSNGELLSTEGNLLKFADELTRRFGPQLGASLDTFTTDLGRAQNSVFNMRLAIAEGLIPALREALKSFNTFANSAEGAEIFRQMGEAAGKLIGILVEVPKYFDLIVLAVKGLVAIKIGSWVASLGGGLRTAAAGFTTYSNAVLSATVQGQRLTFAQRHLMMAVRSAAGVLTTYEARLRATTAASGGARIGTLALANTVGALRTAMLGAAAVARTMWVAIGGPVGIAIAAVSFIYANWKSDADKATAALREHERQVEAVRQAYQAAEKGASDWAKSVSKVELPGAVKNLKTLMAAFDEARINLANAVSGRLGGTIAMLRGDFGETSALIAQLTEDFVEGSLSAKEYGESLAEIYNNTDDLRIKKVLEDAGKLISELADQESGLKRQARLVELLGGNVKDLAGYNGDLADAAEILGQTVEETNKAFDNSEFIKTYTDAIDKLKESIPELAAELKELKAVTELNETAWKGLVAAWNAGDYSKILEIASLWGRAQSSLASQRQGRMLDSYGAGSKDVIERIIYVEGGQKGDGPSTSSARGIGQFIDSTWLSYLNRLYPELRELNDTQKLALRTSEEHAMKIMEAFTRDNQERLLRAGVGAGPTETYLAHFLGAGDAIKVLLANPEELAAEIVNSDSVAANPSVFKPGMTVQDLINWSAGKMGDGSRQLGGGQTESEKQREDGIKATRRRLEDLDHQIAQQRLINEGKEREAAIEDAIRQARAENKNITDAELATIRERVGALWDEQNARLELELSEERVNQLYQLRQQLLEQMKMAQESGDLGTVEALREQINGLNDQLQQAIEKAMGMWAALGGPEADAAIAKLKTMQMSIRAAGSEIGLFGISIKNWENLFDGFADGIVNAFDSMAQAIANGENAWEAFGQAALQAIADILREIAKLILKQMMLNALKSMGLPIPTGHTGGLVGSKAIGSGNAIRRPQWVSDAYGLSYHSGGLAGFAPDEVSATLKLNEEVLTEEDPRHRFNLGGEAAPKDGTRLKQVLAIGDKEIANAMAGAAGEQVQLTVIKRNATTIRRILGM